MYSLYPIHLELRMKPHSISSNFAFLLFIVRSFLKPLRNDLTLGNSWLHSPTSLPEREHLGCLAFYSEKKVRLPDNRSEGNPSNPSGGQVRWLEKRRGVLLMLWQLCQYNFISMYRTMLVFKKQNSTSVVFMNSSLSWVHCRKSRWIWCKLCVKCRTFGSLKCFPQSLLDLVSISSGLLFNGSRWHLTQLILRYDQQCAVWTERWVRDQILSATLKILLQLEENTKYGTKNFLLVQQMF